MTRGLVFRPAVAADAPDIVEIVRAGFTDDLLDKFIYGCAGIERYVRSQIEARARGTDTLFTIAMRDDAIVGTCEMRALRDRLFLNYIAVRPDTRAGGVGNGLLAAAIESTARLAHQAISLDVLDDNTVANRWYRGLGFAEESATDWWTAPVTPTGETAGTLAGLPQAAVCYEAFGFAQISVSTPAAAFDIGVLGTHWFRVTQAAALVEPAVHIALHNFDPHRGLLALLPHGALPAETPATRATGTRRMSTPLTALREALQRKLR